MAWSKLLLKPFPAFATMKKQEYEPILNIYVCIVSTRLGCEGQRIQSIKMASEANNSGECASHYSDSLVLGAAIFNTAKEIAEDTDRAEQRQITEIDSPENQRMWSYTFSQRADGLWVETYHGVTTLPSEYPNGLDADIWYRSFSY